MEKKPLYLAPQNQTRPNRTKKDKSEPESHFEQQKIMHYPQ
jgi:hypothetical protein